MAGLQADNEFHLGPFAGKVVVADQPGHAAAAVAAGVPRADPRPDRLRALPGSGPYPEAVPARGVDARAADVVE